MDIFDRIKAEGLAAQAFATYPVYVEAIREIREESYLREDRANVDPSLTEQQKDEVRRSESYLRSAIYKLDSKLQSKAAAASTVVTK